MDGSPSEIVVTRREAGSSPFPHVPNRDEVGRSLEQAPSQPPILQGFRGCCWEPGPFFRSLSGK
jgi:hypothetical protein